MKEARTCILAQVSGERNFVTTAPANTYHVGGWMLTNFPCDPDDYAPFYPFILLYLKWGSCV